MRLIGGRSPEREERVVLRPRGAVRAGHGLAAGYELPLHDMHLARPGSGEADHHPVGIGQVDHDAHRRTEIDRVFACGADGGAPGDQGTTAKDRETQLHLEAGQVIGERDLQRLRLRVFLDIR